MARERQRVSRRSGRLRDESAPAGSPSVSSKNSYPMAAPGPRGYGPCPFPMPNESAGDCKGSTRPEGVLRSSTGTVADRPAGNPRRAHAPRHPLRQPPWAQPDPTFAEVKRLHVAPPTRVSADRRRPRRCAVECRRRVGAGRAVVWSSRQGPTAAAQDGARRFPNGSTRRDDRRSTGLAILVGGGTCEGREGKR